MSRAAFRMQFTSDDKGARSPYGRTAKNLLESAYLNKRQHALLS
jgi:hypothetical protein